MNENFILVAVFVVGGQLLRWLDDDENEDGRTFSDEEQPRENSIKFWVNEMQ